MLLRTYRIRRVSLSITCQRLHRLLRHLYHARVPSNDLRVASLSTHVDFITSGTKLSAIRRGHLRAFQLASGTVLGHRTRPRHRRLLHSTGALTFFIGHLAKRRVPTRLCHLLPHTSTACVITPPTGRQVGHVHIYFRCTSSACLCMLPMSAITSRPLHIHCGMPRVGRRFTRAYQVL